MASPAFPLHLARVRRISEDTRRSRLDRAALMAVLSVLDRAVDLLRRYLATGSDANTNPEALLEADLVATELLNEIDGV